MLKKILIILFFSFYLEASERTIMVASTTSTYDSGLLNYLHDFFEKKYSINVKVLSLGTGQAIRTAKDGNVEVLLVHHKKTEIDFMKNNFGLIRYDLMYNDFILVGPKSDNKGCLNINSKLNYIFNSKLFFISRGDDSGTHKKELELWNDAGLIPEFFQTWYINIGQGMGNTLLMANEKFAYSLTDRSTWISFNRKDNLKIICENSPPLFNQYGLILVNPKINNRLNINIAKIYVEWLISDEGKRLINRFKKNGKQLFFFNHH